MNKIIKYPLKNIFKKNYVRKSYMSLSMVDNGLEML